MENIQLDTQEIVRIIMLLLFIIFVIYISTNITGIVIHYHILEDEINDIEDKDLKLDLLQDLNYKTDVFFKRVFYHKEEDFFNSKTLFKKLIVYRIRARDNLFIFREDLSKDREDIAYAKEA